MMDPSSDNNGAQALEYLSSELEKARRHITFLESSLNGLQLQYDNVARRIERFELTLTDSYRQLAEKSYETEGLRKELTVIQQLKAELEHSHVVIRSAEKWQNRSLIKRMFHKWRPPKRTVDQPPLDLSALYNPEQVYQSQTLSQNLGIGLPLNTAKVACGIFVQNSISEELDLCVNSIRRSFDTISTCITVHISVSSKTYANKAVALEAVENADTLSFPAFHNVMMRDAFSKGAHFYILANERASAASSTFSALFQHALANESKSLIESVRFPVSHSKGYNTDTFETPYLLPTFVLVPRAIFEAVGPLDEQLDPTFSMIDFSWRARQKGFGVKTCPRSLCFHPIGGSPFDSRVQEAYLTSGILLSRKYGNRYFEKKMLSDALISEIKLHAIPSIEQSINIFPDSDFRAIASFEENQL